MKRRNFITQTSLFGTAAALSPLSSLQAQADSGPVRADLLNRIKSTGSIPTPFYTYVHYHGNKWLDYGDEKMKWMFGHKSFLEYDIPVAPASDYTPGPFEPLMAIQSMVTRKDFKGRV